MNDPTGFIIFRFTLIVAELWLFVFVLLCTTKKRPLWWLRSIGVLLIVEGVTVGLCFAAYGIYKNASFDNNVVSLVGAGIQLIILLLLSVGFYFCFDVTLYELGSIVSLGYTARWIFFSVYSLALNFIDPSLFLIRINQQTPLNITIYVALFAAYFAINAYLVFSKAKGEFTLQLPAFIALAIIILLNTFLITFAETFSEDHLLEYSYVLISNIVSLGLIVAINFFMKRQEDLSVENKLINSMLIKQTMQYKFDKANAEALHVKAHDLKHQVAILRKGGPDAERLLDELESVVYNYESVVLTDNPVINVTLSEKWQYCIKHRIKMTCSVDPKALTKMDNVHLYSMLGNVLDNAIEAVMQIKDKEKRLISLTITCNHGVSIVRCYNYFIGEVHMEDGLPVTKKDDFRFHGYGLKSIKSIAELYGGGISITAENGIFDLRVTVFDPEEQQK